MAGVEGDLSPYDCSTIVCPSRCARSQYKNECISYCSMCCQKCSCPYALAEKILNKGNGEVPINNVEDDCKYICGKSCGRIGNKDGCLEKCYSCCAQCVCPFPGFSEQLLLNTNTSMLH
ncbi:hypothetical protein MtrunA17_Chr3g0121401 [Medicago truncatula]|nr:hypothetical protein MtrunA17_Chr3g0121401 [Medicago truncatula]